MHSALLYQILVGHNQLSTCIVLWVVRAHIEYPLADLIAKPLALVYMLLIIVDEHNHKTQSFGRQSI